ncbi:hypothetical protein SKAU_G00089660 [Synaphobranchus kaupii]|uniref:Uncharacterized protein n=1 Tax=Synaphobranchus kaupii TaxID=118154 RepID=A0A9Q1FX91_SYNKA|nr:hypothetical protein SKAU_G00089660 [Synaphobranchus kaupii]
MKEKTIKRLKTTVKQSEHALEEKEELVQMLTQKLSLQDKWKQEKVALQKRLSVMRGNVARARQERHDSNEQAEASIQQLKAELKQMERRERELQAVVDCTERDEVATFENGRYTNEIREVCMTLLTEGNVSIRKLPKVLTTVIKNLTGKVPQRLPSKTLLSSRIMMEARIVASKQVSLKSGKHLTLGLRQVAGGDAETYLTAFKESIDSLAAAITSAEEEKSVIVASLVSSIKCLMSDQAAVNGVFNRLLAQFREELLPSIIPEFDSLSTDQQQQLVEMGTFACRMHLLVNMEPAAARALHVLDITLSEGTNPHSLHSEEAGTRRVIRTAAALFTRRGSAVAGAPDMWEVFLRGKGQQKNHLVTYHGRRMNISFQNALALYFHWEDATSFLADWPADNDLIKSVRYDIKEPLYRAGCRAMGLIYALLMEPFERILKMPGNILDLNTDLERMLSSLQVWSSDGSVAMKRGSVFAVQPLDNELTAKIFGEVENAEENAFTQLAIELISAEMLIVLQRQASIQLPGGKHWEPSTPVQQMAKTVPKTNMLGECDMAVLDNLLRSKPSISSHNLETLVMWWQNKPSNYLDSLSPAERTKVLDEARRQVPSFIVSMKEKKASLQMALEEKMAMKIQSKEAKDAALRATKMRLTQDVTKWGGPWSKEEVQSRLDEIGSGQWREALLAQIRFQKTVLNSAGERHLFQESREKRKYTVEELKRNLMSILEANFNVPQIPQPGGLAYRSREERQVVVSDCRAKMLFRLKEAERKGKIEQAKSRLEEFSRRPELLVGKRVMHQCRENGNVEWFPATVSGLKEPQEEEDTNTLFNIKYDVCEELWCFPLLKDIKNNDLYLV